MIKRSLSLLALWCGLLWSVHPCDVRFTVYPEGGHVEAWQNAYGDPDLWEWLAKQRQAG